MCAWDSPRVDGEGMRCFIIIIIIIFKSETLPAPAPALEVRVRNPFFDAHRLKLSARLRFLVRHRTSLALTMWSFALRRVFCGLFHLPSP